MSRPKRTGGQSVTIPLSTYGARVLLAWTTALRTARRPMENSARATGAAATIATRMGGDAGRGSGRRQGRRLERDPTEGRGPPRLPSVGYTSNFCRSRCRAAQRGKCADFVAKVAEGVDEELC